MKESSEGQSHLKVRPIGKGPPSQVLHQLHVKRQGTWSAEPTT
ncbi:hypothetical protein [Streptomyces sp. NPDC001809]